jgi:hypothetical protein
MEGDVSARQHGSQNQVQARTTPADCQTDLRSESADRRASDDVVAKFDSGGVCSSPHASSAVAKVQLLHRATRPVERQAPRGQ